MVLVCVTDVNVTRDEVRQVDNYLVDQVEQLTPSQLASLYTSRVGREGGKNTLYGIDNTEISETVLKYQISDFP